MTSDKPWPEWKITTPAITLRDLFAAFVAAGLVVGDDVSDHARGCKFIAETSYELADALLAQRGEGREGRAALRQALQQSRPQGLPLLRESTRGRSRGLPSPASQISTAPQAKGEVNLQERPHVNSVGRGGVPGEG